MCGARRGGPRTPSTTTDANLDCAFVENTLFYTYPRLKSQRNRIVLVTRPATPQLWWSIPQPRQERRPNRPSNNSRWWTTLTGRSRKLWSRFCWPTSKSTRLQRSSYSSNSSGRSAAEGGKSLTHLSWRQTSSSSRTSLRPRFARSTQWSGRELLFSSLSGSGNCQPQRSGLLR